MNLNATEKQIIMKPKLQIFLNESIICRKKNSLPAVRTYALERLDVRY